MGSDAGRGPVIGSGGRTDSGGHLGNGNIAWNDGQMLGSSSRPDGDGP
jgi:hypothetical protein